MAGTSTIPAFSGAAQKRMLTVSMIDASADTDSVSARIDAAAADAAVQAYLDAYQAASQASSYKAVDEFTYSGVKAASNATNDQRSSVKDGINMLYRDLSDLSTYTNRLKAPTTDVMDGDKDIPLLAGTKLQALGAAVIALKSGFALETAQYSERVERAGQNEKVSN